MPNFTSGTQHGAGAPLDAKIDDTLAAFGGGATKIPRGGRTAAHIKSTAKPRRSMADPASTRDRLARLEAFSTA